jgi:hypothetical protein
MSVFPRLENFLFEEDLEKYINEKLSQERENIEKAIFTQKEELLKENEVLRNELGELQNKIEKKEGKRITANRQLLLLHYLEVFDTLKFPSKEKKYSLLYLIIDKTPQTVKEFFIHREQFGTEGYNKIFNEEDLYFVLDLLKEVGLLDQAKKVDSHMIELKI